MTDENNFIKEYWENQAKTHKDSHWTSWGDIYLINLEKETISSLKIRKNVCFIEDLKKLSKVKIGNGTLISSRILVKNNIDSFETVRGTPTIVVGDT